MKPGPTRQLVADNLRRELEGQSLSLNEFASDAGVSRSQVYDVLAGRKAPSVDWLEKVSAALKIEPWTLLKRGAKSSSRPVGKSAPKAKTVKKKKKR
ncbi:MAG: helix-turn-helix transcriptional regulator [Clostridia bacterium]|nr:helix-turn-helix transcriptional regulator [Deltaproteobacteria bacterium]